jgi:nitrogen fixation protein NifU and related proteins
MALSADPPPPVVAGLPPEASLASLYQEIILSHYRAPKHKGALNGEIAAIEHRNPLCGDVLSVQISFDSSRITDAAFSARACSITQAAASMVLDRVIGGTVADAEDTVSRVERLIETTAPLTALESHDLGDLRALASVSRFPARKACVRLVLSAVREAIAAG